MSHNYMIIRHLKDFLKVVAIAVFAQKFDFCRLKTV
jgi:hypothetical protein